MALRQPPPPSSNNRRPSSISTSSSRTNGSWVKTVLVILFGIICSLGIVLTLLSLHLSTDVNGYGTPIFRRVTEDLPPLVEKLPNLSPSQNQEPTGSDQTQDRVRQTQMNLRASNTQPRELEKGSEEKANHRDTSSNGKAGEKEASENSVETPAEVHDTHSDSRKGTERVPKTSSDGNSYYCSSFQSSMHDWNDWLKLLRVSKDVSKSYHVFSTIEDSNNECFHFQPILLPKVSKISKTDWTAIIRVQKTASKTVTAILLWLLADAFKGDNAARTVCNANYFGTSAVPAADEVKAMRDVMPASRLFRDAYSQRVEFAKSHVSKDTNYWSAVENARGEKSIVLDNPWIRDASKIYDFKGLRPESLESAPQQIIPVFDAEAVKPWYKGAELEEYRRTRKESFERGCSGFDQPQKITPNSFRCNYIFQQHMHAGDIFGSLWETMAVKSEGVRIITALRHPVRRTLSEYKHLAIGGQPVWDYCHHPKFKGLAGHWTSGNEEFGKDDHGKSYFRNFMLNHYHAFGMRNRQVKMVSGLVTEPEVPTLDQNRAAFQQLVDGVMDSEGKKQYAPGPESSETQLPDEYLDWARTALRQAQFQILNSSAVVLMERLPESIAVMLYTFDWRPRVTVPDSTKRFPSSRISEDPLLFGVWEGKGYDYDADEDASRKDELSKKPQNYHFQGANLDKSIHISSEIPHIVDNTMRSATDDSKHITEGAHHISAPSSRAWERLLHISRALSEQLTNRENVDQRKIPFELDDAIFNDILATNHLDASLFYWVDQLLSARVGLVKRELAALEANQKE